MDEIIKKIEEMSVEEIQTIINDSESGGKNYALMRKVMSGSTALIGLMDPAKENLWVANLGDCQASKHPSFSLSLGPGAFYVYVTNSGCLVYSPGEKY